MAKRVLITGAGGFIGGFIVAEALNRGYETWAAVRKSTSRKYLTDERINFIELDFSDAAIFRSQMADAIAVNGKWDFVVHNLGATKCNNFNDFNSINYGYMKLLVDTLTSLDAVPERFLLMSSLSAVGPGDEDSYTPMSTRDIPHPNTRYGLSKMKAETYLSTRPGFPYIIFRPTGVYGPHEKDYFMMMKSIKRGFDFSVGFRRQMLTFIYVTDLADAIFDALESNAARKTYIIAEHRAYSQDEFRKIVAEKLHKRFVIPIKVPIWMLYVVSFLAELWGTITLKPSTLNRDKFKIMRQRNWCCDVSDAINDFGFCPKHSLAQGVSDAIDWYKENKWI